MVCATQVIRPRLLKYLAAFCMLDCVRAATLPSAPAPKFEADVPNPSYNTAALEGLRLLVREQAATIEAKAATIEGQAATIEALRVEQ
eukprot:scaffold60261_cov97-Phaeocystis_antarctica.AAC.2